MKCVLVLLCSVAAATPVNVTLEPQIMRSIGGLSELSRHKWFTVHEEPFNSVEWRSQDTEQFGPTGYNSYLGRGFTVSGAMSKSVEDDLRPGYVNNESLLAFCGASCPAGPDNPNTPKRCRTSGWHPHSVDFVHSSKPDHFFEGGCAKPPKRKPGFVPTTPDAAADFFSQYFRHCLAAGAASHPQEIIEVMNEVEAHLFDCTGHWGLVGAQQVVAINVAIADRLHADYGFPGARKSNRQPAALVAGPVGAHPEFQDRNFNAWKKFYSVFIKNAGPHMDALAMHYYDTYLQGGDGDDASADYLVRSGSNLEALLDLQEAYALATLDKVLPQLVSEYGSGFKVKGIKYSPVHDWWVLRGVNSKMMQFMNRPDRVVKAIPFIVAKAIWHLAADGPTVNDSSTTPYPFVLWRNTQRQKADKNKATDTWSETHLHKFYQMWEELPDGAQRFAVGSDDANIQVQGFRANGVPDTLFVAVNSLRPWKASGAPTKVDLSWVTDGAAFGSGTTLKRLFFDRTTRTPTLTTATLDAVPQSLNLMPEELVLLKVELPTPVAWHTHVETVATYQSTQTISTLNHTRPAHGLPFPTLPTHAAGTVTARVSLGGLNETLATALAGMNVELSGHACTVRHARQIAGETRVNPNDGSFMGAMAVECGAADAPLELRVWSTRTQDDGLMLTSAVLVVKTRRATTPSSAVPSPSSPSTSVPASSSAPSSSAPSSSAPSSVIDSPSSAPSPTPTTHAPASSSSPSSSLPSSSAPSPVTDSPSSVPSPTPTPTTHAPASSSSPSSSAPSSNSPSPVTDSPSSAPSPSTTSVVPSPTTKARATPSPTTKKPDTKTTPSPIPAKDKAQSTIAVSVALQLPPTTSITTEELQAPNVKQGLEVQLATALAIDVEFVTITAIYLCPSDSRCTPSARRLSRAWARQTRALNGEDEQSIVIEFIVKANEEVIQQAEQQMAVTDAGGSSSFQEVLSSGASASLSKELNKDVTVVASTTLASGGGLEGGSTSDTKAKSSDAKNDSGFVIALSCGGLLLFVGAGVVFYLCRKKAQAPGRHMSPQEEEEVFFNSDGDVELSTTTRSTMQFTNPLDQQNKFQTTDGTKMAWKTHQTEDNETYYEDAQSGRTTWTARDSSGIAKEAWKTHRTEDNETYYEDAQSGRTTWTARDASGVAIKKPITQLKTIKEQNTGRRAR